MEQNNIERTRKYKESLKTTAGPIFLNDFKSVKIDYTGLIAYAKEKGVRPIDLTDAEREQFVVSKK